ncbi:hypothetical protein DUNSADRAFT_163 [Dunaliella salina]|uniref:Uncharacterized protein n=1 Tax=Dunaliella salina TaxID=3046 RepID=A0ABQ7FZE9_DUNSA|nr:hypothetical protein DUNSADRAFT_163 [Dunaliella salina]|eukprot:KAF5827730.1 hypothetical protein DUNSADRAFT_163 [Dunaliella salina]
MLQGEVRLLEQERARLMREVKLKTELEEGYAKRGAKQAAAIKDSAMKIATLEGSLGQEASEACLGGCAKKEVATESLGHLKGGLGQVRWVSECFV